MSMLSKFIGTFFALLTKLIYGSALVGGFLVFVLFTALLVL